jgi:transcriptional regulator GlxA family with amidase domain
MSLNLDKAQSYDLCFMLDSDYSELSLVLMLETLRQANSVLSDKVYRYVLVSDNEQLTQDNARIRPLSELAAAQVFDMVIALGGHKFPRSMSAKQADFIGLQYRKGACLAGIESGVYALSLLGLLDKKPASCHANHLSDLSATFSRVAFNNNIFSFNENIYTCPGGMATTDMTMNIIDRITPTASEWLYAKLVIKPPHSGSTSQKTHVYKRFAGLAKSLINAVELMESNLGEPLEIPEIAHHSGVSTRQLERLFQKHFSNSPKKFYLQLRLKRARNKILNTSHSIFDVALSCGFVAPTHFSKCYKDFFGISPRQDRLSIYDLQKSMMG